MSASKDRKIVDMHVEIERLRAEERERLMALTVCGCGDQFSAQGVSMSAPSPWGSGDSMAIAAVRYCLGRQTYIVGECVSWLRANWERIEPQARTIIQRDIEEAFAQDDMIRARGQKEFGNYKPLGWDCDRAEWEKARKLWEPKP